MQALGPGLPLLAPAPMQTGQAQAFPAQDLFQSLLQGRMVAQALPAGLVQGQGGDAKSSVSWKSPFSASAKTMTLPGSRTGAQLAATPGIPGPASATPLNGAKPGPLRILVIPPERLPEVALCLTQAGVPPEQVQGLLSDPKVREQGLSLAQLRDFWRQSGLSRETGDLPDPDLPPALAELAASLQDTPGQTLPLTPTRQPEVAAMLLTAGLPLKEVERLLNSPGAREQGLNLNDVKAAWQRAQGDGASPEEPLTLTSQADYQRQWARLNLPVSALPDLRLALQQLGATPEALSALEDKATPQGIPVGQVWRLLKEIKGAGPENAPTPQTPPAPETPASSPASPPVDAKEVEGWRQLLVKAGMDQETAAALLGGTAPASREELKARLLAAAPKEPPPAQELPKPLYLPENLRLRSLAWQGRQDQHPGAGQGDGEARRQEAGNPGKVETIAAASAGAPEGQSHFASLLAADSPLNSNPAALTGRSEAPATASWLEGGQEIRALWSQVKEGLLSGLKTGESQIRLTLDPPELGHLKLILQLKGQDLEVVAVASRPEAVELARGGVEHLVQALSQQGLLLTQFTVHLEGGPGRQALAAAPAVRSGRRDETLEGGRATGETRPSRVDCFV